MLFKLNEDEILEICTRCEHLEGTDTCSMPDHPKPVSEVKKCSKWNEFYGGNMCLRASDS